MNRKGQSVLEYVIILTAIIAAVVLFATALGPKVTSVLTKASDEMVEGAQVINFGD